MKITIKQHLEGDDDKRAQSPALVFDKGPYKIDIEIEEEVGDDITKVTGIRGLNLRDNHIKIPADCWYEKYKNNRKK